MLFSQLTRLAQITSPLPPNSLLLSEMSGSDELGRLFEYELQLTSQDSAIDLNQLLGKPMCLSLQMSLGAQRHFHGIVARCSQSVDRGQFASYRVTLRPWLWLLTRTSDCRIFQNQSAPQIVKQVFRDLGFSDFEEQLSRSYREREYCVQYRETSFEFISRLLEEEGIYYYFRHEQERHVLVLADAYGAHQSVAGYESVPFYPPDGQHRERDHINDWYLAQEVQPGSLELNDYDFQRPGARINVRSAMPRPHQAGDYPLFDYPGEYQHSEHGEHYARTRLEALQTQHERVELSGNARGLGSGHLFSLSGFTRADQNREYLIVAARYHVVQERLESGGGNTSAQFHGNLSCIDAQQSFRPLASTQRPLVKGPQTAVVVGPAGEEIWTDQYGRVKVHFHWDRHDQSNENSSCWIRVSQAWAGKNWGSMQVPRIGQEVIVSFLEGDPDQPIITGRVYNAEQTVPYDLPASATQSGIKSRSSKGGSPANFNEIRMEDKKGEEQLYVHAERNLDTVVEQNETLSVGANRTQSVGQMEQITIGASRLRAVRFDDVVMVGASKSDSIGASYLLEVGNVLRLVCGKSVIELNASGQINISCEQFSFHARQDAEINTGGTLDLNLGGGAQTSADGQGIQKDIQDAVEGLFPDANT
ncbi:type VI secretion system tip protein VgrG [Pseudomonas cremoricolorata]|uniref:Type VI secretion protein ImpA n=1 Tax=Pseudomonas cremoricolorata TaxID=157783 RepID=A0A089WN92_9PSED|nr:type VI secretion system tip protein VgrG [Pseudomonas cremoricolorata]AIR88614.1 type VI secretion protein ImpA [Pseudomonas cremoricolorata]